MGCHYTPVECGRSWKPFTGTGTKDCLARLRMPASTTAGGWIHRYWPESGRSNRRLDSAAFSHRRQTATSSTVAAGPSVDYLLHEIENVRSSIKRAAPTYAAVSRQPLTVDEIQRFVLDSASLLLKYTLGDSAAYVWAVSSTSARSYRLEKPGGLGRLAERYRAAV